MDTVKDHEFYKGLAKAIETYMKYGSPGYDDPFVLRMSHSCAEALLRLLKGQEPVKPKEERLNDVDSIFRCGNCGTHFYYRQQKYCAICGRKAKWDE